MTANQTQTLPEANACAYQMSRTVYALLGVQQVWEVRQVSASGFTYCERGATDKGQLVGAFKNGQVVA
jgi:hypothetical protein